MYGLRLYLVKMLLVGFLVVIHSKTVYCMMFYSLYFIRDTVMRKIEKIFVLREEELQQAINMQLSNVTLDHGVLSLSPTGHVVLT